VPLSNPKTAPALLKLAAAIARDRHYELECLQVITVSRSIAPAEAVVRTTLSRRLLRQAEQLGRSGQISVHTQIRVAHDPTQAILETLKDRHIDLVLMGWKGSTTTPGRVFGSVVDTIVRQAACEVLLVKLSDSERFDRWLVPIAGGPNAQIALQLLPALMNVGEHPEVRLCQVFDPEAFAPDMLVLQEAMTALKDQLNCPIFLRPVRGYSIPESVVSVARQDLCNVIMLGASREGLLQQAIKGNIPEAIARDSHCTVILVRGAIAKP
jgi:chloride channel protein, CIC family